LSDAEATPQPQAGPAPEPIEWPRCGYCGSTKLRESRRGGFLETCLRWAGCTLYRCENCERRFAFAALGRPHRHNDRVPLKRRETHALEPRVVGSSRRGVLLTLLTVLAALLTFGVAVWLISDSERRRIEYDPSKQ
jgi:hypothetical protein